ncbi:hypothetical protein AUP68_03987 [Ilyonectria robusta]
MSLPISAISKDGDEAVPPGMYPLATGTCAFFLSCGRCTWYSALDLRTILNRTGANPQNSVSPSAWGNHLGRPTMAAFWATTSLLETAPFCQSVKGTRQSHECLYPVTKHYGGRGGYRVKHCSIGVIPLAGLPRICF